MKEAILTRTESAATHTLGVLEYDGGKLFTMEPPWADNRKNESCIPTGIYPCIMRKSPKYGWKYWLQGTGSRSFILIHGGNLVQHTKGCILPGLRRGTLKGQPAVLTSKAAVSQLMTFFENQPFQLEIRYG